MHPDVSPMLVGYMAEVRACLFGQELQDTQLEGTLMHLPCKQAAFVRRLSAPWFVSWLLVTFMLAVCELLAPLWLVYTCWAKWFE